MVGPRSVLFLIRTYRREYWVPLEKHESRASTVEIRALRSMCAVSLRGIVIRESCDGKMM